MDWLTFASKIIQALAWPVSIVIIIFLLRKQILELIPKITKLEAGPLKAEFSSDVKRALVDVEEINLASTNLTKENKLSFIPTDEFLYQDSRSVALWRSAAINPASGIADAWKDIEYILLEIIRTRGVFIPHRRIDSVGVWINAIASSQILPIETISVINDLYSLRNKVVHSEFIATPDAAQDYLLAAQRLIRVLNSYVVHQEN